MRFPTFVLVALILLLNVGSSIRAQEDEASPPAQYHLTGTDVFIESLESGSHVTAQGDVVLTYSYDHEIWTLSAGNVEFTETYETLDDGTRNYTSRIAVADENIRLEGPGVSLAAPGSMTVDIINRHLVSDSEDIHLLFENGELTTDYIEITGQPTGNGNDVYLVTTDKSTTAVYNLASFQNVISLPETGDGSSTQDSGSLFGSLRFDFNIITIETTGISLTVENGNPVILECSDQSVITSASNTLTMPSFNIQFDPPALVGNDGVVLTIGEDTEVEAAALSISYPESEMHVEFMGSVESGEPAPGLPERVTIRHTAGTFSADAITIDLNSDGTQSIHATGDATFEIPLSTIIE
jgi:hypothetical protein